MKLKISAFFWSALVVSCITATAQQKNKVEFGKITVEDFRLSPSSVIDSNSSAVIISDVGSTDFVGNNRNWFSYVFKRSVRAKVINKDAFELATAKIRLYGTNESQDRLSDLKAATYNVENGKVVESRLDLKDVYHDNVSSSFSIERFTLPAVKEGSIIEYSYTITSYHFNRLPSWRFQHLSYPTLYSEYQVTIPNTLSYLIAQHGVDSFFVNKTEQKKVQYTMRDVNVQTIANQHLWTMEQVPAFKEEPYIYSPQEFLDKLEFYLSQVHDGVDLHNIATTWYKAGELLLADKQFGAALPAVDFSNLTNIAERVTKKDTNPLEMAKSIFYYIRDNFTCINNNDIYASNDLYVVNKNKKGNVADINLLLTGLLRQKGIAAEPVVLSTREYGVNSPDYPILDKLNYVICMARVNGETIFLDATNPLVGFGKLPLKCYNGHARVVGQNIQTSVFFNADDVKESKTIVVTIKNGEDGKQIGRHESSLGYFESQNVREQIARQNVNRYLDGIRSAYGKDVRVKNVRIDSLNNTELPIRVTYDFDYTNDKESMIYFNPIIGKTQEVLLKSDKRKYPVEMPYPIDQEYVLTMEIPTGYEVEELPKSAQVSFNGGEGFFHYLIQKDENRVQLRSHVKLNHAIFAAEDYDSLRNFFAYILKKQNEQIVFKKKK